MEKKAITEFLISEKPGPMALLVETTHFTIKSKGGVMMARKTVTYSDPTVNVTIVLRGQKGQEYKMTMMINDVEKEIEGELAANGVNTITKNYPVTDFNL